MGKQRTQWVKVTEDILANLNHRQDCYLKLPDGKELLAYWDYYKEQFFRDFHTEQVPRPAYIRKQVHSEHPEG